MSDELSIECDKSSIKCNKYIDIGYKLVHGNKKEEDQMLIETKLTRNKVAAMYVNPHTIVSVVEYENVYYMTTVDGSNTEITRESYNHIVKWMAENNE